jgi:hypothetical protein
VKIDAALYYIDLNDKCFPLEALSMCGRRWVEHYDSAQDIYLTTLIAIGLDPSSMRVGMSLCHAGWKKMELVKWGKRDGASM